MSADHTGFLLKLSSGTIARKQQRYAELRGELLYYWQDKPADTNTTPAAACIDLRGAKIDGSNAADLSIKMSGPEIAREIVWYALDAGQYQVWLSKLTARNTKNVDSSVACLGMPSGFFAPDSGVNLGGAVSARQFQAANPTLVVKPSSSSSSPAAAPTSPATAAAAAISTPGNAAAVNSNSGFATAPAQKSIAAFFSDGGSDAPAVDCSGFLVKGQGHKAQKRYFILVGQRMFWYATRPNSITETALGVINVTDSTVADTSLSVTITGPHLQKAYLLSCKSPAERQAWVDNLKVSSGTTTGSGSSSTVSTPRGNATATAGSAAAAAAAALCTTSNAGNTTTPTTAVSAPPGSAAPDDVASSASSDMEGFLDKLGGGSLLTRNQSRYFVLKGRTLQYFKSKPATAHEMPQGVIDMSGCIISSGENTFSLNGPHLNPEKREKNTYIFTTMDEEQQGEWVRALKTLNIDNRSFASLRLGAAEKSDAGAAGTEQHTLDDFGHSMHGASDDEREDEEKNKKQMEAAAAAVVEDQRKAKEARAAAAVAVAAAAAEHGKQSALAAEQGRKVRIAEDDAAIDAAVAVAAAKARREGEEAAVAAAADAERKKKEQAAEAAAASPKLTQPSQLEQMRQAALLKKQAKEEKEKAAAEQKKREDEEAAAAAAVIATATATAAQAREQENKKREAEDAPAAKRSAAEEQAAARRQSAPSAAVGAPIQEQQLRQQQQQAQPAQQQKQVSDMKRNDNDSEQEVDEKYQQRLIELERRSIATDHPFSPHHHHHHHNNDHHHHPILAANAASGNNNNNHYDGSESSVTAATTASGRTSPNSSLSPYRQRSMASTRAGPDVIATRASMAPSMPPLQVPHNMRSSPCPTLAAPHCDRPYLQSALFPELMLDNEFWQAVVAEIAKQGLAVGSLASTSSSSPTPSSADGGFSASSNNNRLLLSGEEIDGYLSAIAPQSPTQSVATPTAQQQLQRQSDNEDEHPTEPRNAASSMSWLASTAAFSDEQRGKRLLLQSNLSHNLLPVGCTKEEFVMLARHCNKHAGGIFDISAFKNLLTDIGAPCSFEMARHLVFVKLPSFSSSAVDASANTNSGNGSGVNPTTASSRMLTSATSSLAIHFDTAAFAARCVQRVIARFDVARDLARQVHDLRAQKEQIAMLHREKQVQLQLQIEHQQQHEMQNANRGIIARVNSAHSSSSNAISRSGTPKRIVKLGGAVAALEAQHQAMIDNTPSLLHLKLHPGVVRPVVTPAANNNVSSPTTMSPASSRAATPQRAMSERSSVAPHQPSASSSSAQHRRQKSPSRTTTMTMPGNNINTSSGSPDASSSLSSARVGAGVVCLDSVRSANNNNNNVINDNVTPRRGKSPSSSPIDDRRLLTPEVSGVMAKSPFRGTLRSMSQAKSREIKGRAAAERQARFDALEDARRQKYGMLTKEEAERRMRPRGNSPAASSQQVHRSASQSSVATSSMMTTNNHHNNINNVSIARSTASVASTATTTASTLGTQHRNSTRGHYASALGIPSISGGGGGGISVGGASASAQSRVPIPSASLPSGEAHAVLMRARQQRADGFMFLSTRPRNSVVSSTPKVERGQVVMTDRGTESSAGKKKVLWNSQEMSPVQTVWSGSSALAVSSAKPRATTPTSSSKSLRR